MSGPNVVVEDEGIDPRVLAADAQTEWTQTVTTAVAHGDGVCYEVVLTRITGDPHAIMDIKRQKDKEKEDKLGAYLAEDILVPTEELDLLLSCFGRLVDSQVPTATGTTEASTLKA